LRTFTFNDFLKLRIKDIKIVSKISYTILRYEADRFLLQAFLQVSLKDRKLIRKQSHLKHDLLFK